MMKESLTKLYQAIGLQRWLPKTLNSESISKAKHDSINGNSPGLADPAYVSWLNEHPSALRSFNSMMDIADGKRIVVFLDYDGTLSPIVSDPDRAFMSDPMRSAVRQLSKHFPTAIISGRSRDKVYEFVKLDEIYYAGSHGMDIMAPPRQSKSYDGRYQSRALDKEGNEFIIFQPAQEFLPAITKMLKEVTETTCDIKGVKIEDNRFCISVHYRHIQEEDYDMLEAKVQSMLLNYPRFHMTRGKKVLEIRPSIKWNKGHALEYLLDTLGFAKANDVLPMYIGDDRTDEDAFKILQKRGKGFPIIVSTTPRDTMASYSLRDTSEVLCFLIRLARWGSERSSSK